MVHVAEPQGNVETSQRRLEVLKAGPRRRKLKRRWKLLEQNRLEGKKRKTFEGNGNKQWRAPDLASS